MLFGRTLFGGALYPRQVTAGGTAVCGATSAAKATAALRDGSGAFATATVAAGTGVRNVLPVPVAVLPVATVTGKALAQLRGYASPSCTAAVQGRARCDFEAKAESLAVAVGAAAIIRTIVQRIPSRLSGLATLEGEAQVYVYVSPARVMCYANPFGTHWFVGRGAAAAQASAQCAAAIIRAAAGGCSAAVAPVIGARFDGTSSGAVGASADAIVDPLLTAAGVRYWDALGLSVGRATLAAAAYTYSVALAVGRAHIQGVANSHRAARSHARGFGEARGSMERVQPEYASVTIRSSATGGGLAHLAALAKAATSVQGAVSATPKKDAAARGRVDVVATGGSGAVWLAAPAGTATGLAASGQAKPLRRTFSHGSTSGAALWAATARTHARPTAQAVGVTTLTAAPQLRDKTLASGSVGPQAEVHALDTRMAQRAAGAAQGVALPEATNRTNNAAQQLSSRVIQVGGEARTVPVTESRRAISVQGAPRLLAA